MNGHGTPSEDLLTRILREFDEHCEQLEPMAEEYKRVMAARAALVAGLEGPPEPPAAPAPPKRSRPAATRQPLPVVARNGSARRRRPEDTELEAIFQHVERTPGVTPTQLAHTLGYSPAERSRLVIRPLSRLHRLGRIQRDGEGFRVAERAPARS